MCLYTSNGQLSPFILASLCNNVLFESNNIVYNIILIGAYYKEFHQNRADPPPPPPPPKSRYNLVLLDISRSLQLLNFILLRKTLEFVNIVKNLIILTLCRSLRNSHRGTRSSHQGPQDVSNSDIQINFTWNLISTIDYSTCVLVIINNKLKHRNYTKWYVPIRLWLSSLVT